MNSHHAPSQRLPFPIQVSFNKTLRTDGEVLMMTITQDGETISLTNEQVDSLLSMIRIKLGKS